MICFATFIKRFPGSPAAPSHVHDLKALSNVAHCLLKGPKGYGG